MNIIEHNSTKMVLAADSGNSDKVFDGMLPIFNLLLWVSLVFWIIMTFFYLFFGIAGLTITILVLVALKMLRQWFLDNLERKVVITMDKSEDSLIKVITTVKDDISEKHRLSEVKEIRLNRYAAGGNRVNYRARYTNLYFVFQNQEMIFTRYRSAAIAGRKLETLPEHDLGKKVAEFIGVELTLPKKEPLGVPNYQ